MNNLDNTSIQNLTKIIESAVDQHESSKALSYVWADPKQTELREFSDKWESTISVTHTVSGYDQIMITESDKGLYGLYLTYPNKNTVRGRGTQPVTKHYNIHDLYKESVVKDLKKYLERYGVMT